MGDADSKGKRGRPTRYHKTYVDVAYNLCRQHGYTDVKLAEAFDVHYNTLRKWKAKHPDFVSAIERGKDEHDNEHVESALLKRAKGCVRKKITKKTFRRGGAQITQTTETAEEVLGSVRAQETWLFNRHPDRWRRVPRDFDDDQGGEHGVLLVESQEDFAEMVKSTTGKSIAENEAEKKAEGQSLG